jgi:hypothetical protein
MLELEAYDTARHAPRKPAWWALYMVGVLLIGSVGVLERYIPPGPARTVLECTAVILAFGLMLLWRHCNRVRWM